MDCVGEVEVTRFLLLAQLKGMRWGRIRRRVVATDMDSHVLCVNDKLVLLLQQNITVSSRSLGNCTKIFESDMVVAPCHAKIVTDNVLDRSSNAEVVQI